MRKELMAAVLSLALAAGLCPAAALAASGGSDDLVAAGAISTLSTQDTAKLDAYEITESGSRSITVGYGSSLLPIAVPAGKFAQMSVSVSGAQDIVGIWLLDEENNVKAVSKATNAKDVPFRIGGSSAQVGYFLISVDSDKDAASQVTVDIKTTVYPITTSGRAVKAGEKVSVAQTEGALYWKVTLPKAQVLTLDGAYGTELCNSKKKELTGNFAVSNNKQYILKKGTYYVRTTVLEGVGADVVDFSFTTKNIGASIGSNTKLKKAQKITLGKKATGVISTVPSVKAHYYKFKLSKAKKVSVSYKSQFKDLLKFVTICDSKGKTVKTKIATGESGKVSAKLAKGTYYIEVEPYSSMSYGTYTVTVK